MSELKSSEGSLPDASIAAGSEGPVIDDGPPQPPTGEEDVPLEDAGALESQIASLRAQLQSALAVNEALLRQSAATSARLASLELRVSALADRLAPLLASYPVETIGEAVVQAIESAQLALSAEGDGHEYTVSDVECDVKGYVSLSGQGAVISLRPLQAAPPGGAESWSVVRFRASKVPVSA